MGYDRRTLMNAHKVLVCDVAIINTHALGEDFAVKWIKLTSDAIYTEDARKYEDSVLTNVPWQALQET